MRHHSRQLENGWIMWRGDRQPDFQAIVLFPKWRVCVPHLGKFLWLRLRLGQTRWSVSCQKAPRHPRILPVAGEGFGPAAGWRPINSAKDWAPKEGAPEKESKWEQHCEKYVTAVAHFQVGVGFSFRGVGILEWRFIGGFTDSAPAYSLV